MAARRASGKKSQAISDQSGFKIPYKSLKTTWEGYRVEPEEWEPKHPQLTPAKNVVDATALFQPRPDNDPENVEISIGYTYDFMLDRNQRPGVGVAGKGSLGVISVSGNSEVAETGVAGTGAVGTITLSITVDASPTGVSGTGTTGTEVPESEILETGVAGTGEVGSEALETEIIETGVVGTGAVGSEAPESELNPSGVAGNGAVEGFGVTGNGNVTLIVTGISGVGGTGTTGTETSESIVVETGLSGSGQIGTVSISLVTNPAWGDGAWGEDAWGE